MSSYEGYPQHSPAPQPSTLARWLPVLVVLLSLLLVMQAWMPRFLDWQAGEAKPRPIAPEVELGSDEKETINLFREASKSVVFITTSEVGRDFFFNVLEIPRG